MEIKAHINVVNLALVAAVVVFAVLYMKGCGDRKTLSEKVKSEELARKAAVDSAVKAQVIVQEGGSIRVGELESKNDSIEGENEVLKYQLHESWKELAATKSKVSALITQVRKENGSNDTNCLELADKADQLNRQLEGQKESIQIAFNNYDKVVSLKDSIISEERTMKQSAINHGQQMALKYSDCFAAQQKLQPRNSLWIGPELNVSPMYAQVGGQLMVVGKRGTAWQGAVGLMSNASYYARVGVVFKISLRKTK